MTSMCTISIDALKADLLAAHVAFESSLRVALPFAIRVGQGLCELKVLVRAAGHSWLEWRQVNLPEIKERRAQRYMRLARKHAELPANLDLTLEEALDTLADPSPTTDPESFELTGQRVPRGKPLPPHEPVDYFTDVAVVHCRYWTQQIQACPPRAAQAIRTDLLALRSAIDQVLEPQ